MLTDDELEAVEWVAEQLWAFDDEDAAHIATLRNLADRARNGGWLPAPPPASEGDG